MSDKKHLLSEFPPISTQEWEETIVKDLKGADYEKKLIWKTQEKFQVKPYYRSEDLDNLSYLESAPGSFPFVRGNESENNSWEVRQDFKIDDIALCNQLAREAAEKGAVAVGLCATNVKNAAQMEQLLNGIDPVKTGIHFICSTSYGETLKLWVEYLDKKGIDRSKVYGSINFDPFNYALSHGNYYRSLEENITEMADIFKTYAEKLPKFRLITVNAVSLHNAGSNCTQELGFALAWANDYLYRLSEKGLAVEDILPRMGWSVGIGSNYFMEIAKIRACRLLWANIVKQYTKKEEAAKLFIHAETSKWNQGIFDAYVNLLRSTTETMSAAIGGADSINVVDFNHAFNQPDEFSTRIARNQQILLKEESFMDKVVDPASGSYYIENLTDSIAVHAWDYFLAVEDLGGFAKAMENGYIQKEVNASAEEKAKFMASRKIVLTGVNQFPNINETMAEDIHKEDCCCCGAEKTTFPTIRKHRGASVFEHLRLQTEAFAKKQGRRPVVFLLTYGNLAMRKARAGFATNFFGCAGYEIRDNAGFANGKEGAEAALAAKADIVVLCSSDEEYEVLVQESLPLLKGKCKVVVAGNPVEKIEEFKSMGVDEFIHVRSNILEVLTNMQKSIIG